MGRPPFVHRLAAFLRRSRHEDELRIEIEAHIEHRTRSLIDEGMDPRDAAFEARRIFGNRTAIREETRDMWSFQRIETLAQDVRFGARLLRRAPVFTMAAIASLAIGIGSAAAVFSLADRLLFRTLPVRSPAELVLFRWISGPETPFRSLNGFGNQTATETSSTSFSMSAFEALRTMLARQAEVFAFADLYRASLAVEGRPETIQAQVVSGNYFAVLGLTPAAGRLLAPPDDRAGAPPAAVIGFDLWQRRFGGAADAVGRTVLVNGVSFTVAGVLPRGFAGTMQVGQPCDVMVPLASYKALTRGDDDPGDPEHWWVLMMARLEPAVTADQIQPSADLVLKQTIAAVRPTFPAGALPRMSVEEGARGQTDIRDTMREPLRIMAAVVLVVLLVACANVANLLLARGRARARELAVRIAIGAPRSRIVRQLLTEGVLLGVLASGVGLVLASWMAAALLPALSPDDPDLAVPYGLDLRILGFTCILATACSLVFALWPALRATDAGVSPGLREASRGAIGTRQRFGTGGVLIVAQVALSMLLLSAAGLLAWSAHKLERVDPGFDPTKLLTFSVDTSLNGYEAARSAAFIAGALERLRAVPGVTGASVTSHRLIANSSASGVARPEGAPPVDPESKEARALGEKNRTWRLAVDEQFFETFGIRILRGKAWSPSISADAPGAVVVNVALARQLFGREDVVGRRVRFGLTSVGKPLEIVGVAADARYMSLRRQPPPTAYLPYQQGTLSQMTFAVRTAGDPMALASTVRETLRQLDDGLPIFGVRTQEEQIMRSLAQERLFARLAALLGGVALALSGIGLYGLLAYVVTSRTPEIGVRLALGAERGQVRWLILRQSLVLVVCGLALGVPAAAASDDFLESLLFGLSPGDPRSVFAAAAVMIVVGLAAAYVPARRASRIDPLSALRAE